MFRKSGVRLMLTEDVVQQQCKMDYHVKHWVSHQ